MHSFEEIITILGPTATGKTQFAVALAPFFNAEIVSADSRQVYREMDLGTGKDLEEYGNIPYHLLDVVEPGIEYNIFQYQQAAIKAIKNIQERNKKVILCGGSGMYIEAILKGYKLFQVPDNKILRNELETCSDEELIEELKNLRALHNHTDTCERPRLIRAIEIEKYYVEHPELHETATAIPSKIIGIKGDRDFIRTKITKRLWQRLEEGMIEEVEQLIRKGTSTEQLIRYGLEYKFLTHFLQGKISREEMIEKLNIAIHQFSKRQMTWFRKMEREGFNIHWIDVEWSMEEKIQRALEHLRLS